MSLPDKSALLMALVAAQGASPFTVTALRDALIEQAPALSDDPANLRRWINTRIRDWVRRGLVVASAGSQRKRQFQATSAFDQLTSATRQPESSPPAPSTQKAPGTTAPSGERDESLVLLSRELEQYRLRSLSQLSEIEEYKRVRDQFPALQSQATARFQATLDANYRLLGKVRALEALLAESTQ